MDHVQADGTFVRFGGETFRIEARLYFRGGVGKKLLLVGMNPGSSRLVEGKEMELKLASEGEYVTGEIVIDKTMQHIVQMMDEACPDFEGTLYMANLFNVRCGNMNAAIKRYVALLAKKDFEPYLLTDMKEYAQAHVFTAVWLGWSLRDESNMNKRKKQVKRMVESLTDQQQIVAKFKDSNPKSIHMWHFRPLLEKHATIYRNEIVPQLKPILNGSEIHSDEISDSEISQGKLRYKLL